MRARFLYGFGLGLVGLGLLTSFAGCHVPNPRHGLIFRGDWSLEINRIPWMAQRGGDGYQQPSVPCDPWSIEGDSCQSFTGKVKILPETPEICNDIACVADKCNSAVNCLAEPSTTKASPARHYPQLARPPTGGGNSRFLPVPTRPVFKPRAVSLPGGGTNSIVEMPISVEQVDLFASQPQLKLQYPDEAANSLSPSPKVILPLSVNPASNRSSP